MKRLSLMVTLVGLFAFGSYQVRAAAPQQDNHNPGQRKQS